MFRGIDEILAASNRMLLRCVFINFSDLVRMHLLICLVWRKHCIGKIYFLFLIYSHVFGTETVSKKPRPEHLPTFFLKLLNKGLSTLLSCNFV